MTGNNRRRATVMATLLSGIWLVFLADPVRAAWAERGTGPGQLGLAGTLAFGATYLGQFHITRREWLEDTRSDQPSHRRLVLGLYVAMLVLAVVVTIALREVGSALWVFIAIAGLWTFPLILGVVIGTAIVATLVFSPPLLGWGIQPGAAMGGALGMLAVGSGRATGRFRQEVERLRMEEERLRLSRDLHDILGHSLTVITVKADLARKLVGRDAEQAEAELADIERLARDALTDVRHTIAGIRTLSLPTELARSRSALRAAGIEAEIPSAADEVPTERREVFAWALREAITNVVRHSGAEHCQISLSPSMIRVVDDGQGPSTADAWSSGLRGIRDRASRAGATLVTEPVEPHGFSLTVTFEGGMTMIWRVLLADDQALVRGAMASLLSLESDIDVVAQVGRGDQVVAAAREHSVDVALLDVEMPGLDGIEAAAALHAALPGVRILIVTTYGRPGYLSRALKAGALGFIVKDTPSDQLAEAVRRVGSGLRVVDPNLAVASLSHGDSPLTDRESEVLKVALEGLSVAEIAKRLHLTEGTVRNHLSAAIGKTDARNRADAARIAQEFGWL